MKTYLQIVAKYLLWIVAIIVCLYSLILILDWTPLWHVLIAAAIVIAIIIFIKRRTIFIHAVAILAALLLIYYFSFEYLPFGKISSSQVVNGVLYKDLMGTYYLGDGLGMRLNLQLTVDGRYFFTWSGCTGIHNRNKGLVLVTDGSLTLQSKTSGYKDREITLIPVKWGDRIYLIFDNKMSDFADSIRSGREPRSRIQGRFYLRINDLEKKCSGFPEVGEKWKYLFNDLPKQIEP